MASLARVGMCAWLGWACQREDRVDILGLDPVRTHIPYRTTPDVVSRHTWGFLGSDQGVQQLAGSSPGDDAGSWPGTYHPRCSADVAAMQLSAPSSSNRGGRISQRRRCAPPGVVEGANGRQTTVTHAVQHLDTLCGVDSAWSLEHS